MIILLFICVKNSKAGVGRTEKRLLINNKKWVITVAAFAFAFVFAPIGLFRLSDSVYSSGSSLPIKIRSAFSAIS